MSGSVSSPLGEDRHIAVFPTSAALMTAAADLFVATAQAAVTDHGRFAVALSGGSTPRGLNTLLASDAYRSQVPWENVWFYWGDERCVAPDNQESNYHMAVETLLSRVPARSEHVFRMPAELPDPEVAANDYAATLRETFELDEDEVPAFDLILLGMGPDGHTASLFPGTSALDVRDRLVAANYVPMLNAHRITLTVPVLNAASSVAFLVAGADKADALAAVLEGELDPRTYPSQLISPVAGQLTWLLDSAAAAKLQRLPQA